MRSLAIALSLLASCQYIATAIPRARCYFSGHQVITEYRMGEVWQCHPVPLEYASSLSEIGKCRIPVFEVTSRCSSALR